MDSEYSPVLVPARPQGTGMPVVWIDTDGWHILGHKFQST